MCMYTISRIRELRNLPEPTNLATAPITQQPNVESILGIDGSDVKNAPGPSSSKKSKKTAPAATTTTKGGRGKKRESDESLPHKLEIADDELLTVSNVVRDTRAPKAAKTKAKAKKESVDALLQPKALNERERKREAERKKDDRSV